MVMLVYVVLQFVHLLIRVSVVVLMFKIILYHSLPTSYEIDYKHSRSSSAGNSTTRRRMLQYDVGLVP